MTCGYLRVSGKGQEDGDGFDRQRLAIEKYAQRVGLQVDAWFEESVTGKSEWEARPAWLEAVAVADCILIERLDRLARDLMVQEHIIADLRHRGIKIISAAEPDLCEDDASRKLMRQIMGAIAEYDRAMIVLKLRGARQRKKAQVGRCEGRKPYGFRPGEEDTLRLMRGWQAEGMRVADITRALNAGEYKSRTGGEWHPYAVARILAAWARRDRLK